MVEYYRQSGLVQTDIINITLSYKYTLCTEIVYTNYFASNLNTFTDKTSVPSFSVLFAYLSINKKPYYNSSLSLNKSINLISIGL